MVWGLGGGTRPPSPKHTHRPQSLSRTKGRTLPQGPRQAEQVNQGNLPWDPDREPGSPAKHRQQSIRNGLSRYSTVLGGWRWWLRVDQQQGHTAQREDSSSTQVPGAPPVSSEGARAGSQRQPGNWRWQRGR